MSKRIVLFGCQQIAVDFIESIINKSDINLLSVYTYELPLDKTYGYASVYDKCIELNIPCEKPQRITNKIIDDIAELQPDYILSVYYRKIFPKKLLSIPKDGCINIHPSMLPEYRGPVPTAWAIMNGETEFGITLHLMDEGIDTGDILVQEIFEIGEEETGYELYTRGMDLGAKMLDKHIEDVLYGRVIATPQKGIGSYYGKLKGKHTINWRDKAENIKNMIRIHAFPYNSAETILFNHYVFINKATVINSSEYILQGPGIIVDEINGNPVVSCADGHLILEEYSVFPKIQGHERSVYFKVGNKFDY